jgi:hypothetical protein
MATFDRGNDDDVAATGCGAICIGLAEYGQLHPE